MTAIAFDTLAASRDLEAAGMERRHAEAVAEVTAQAAGAGHEELATKADIKDFATKADLAAGLARLEARLYLALIGVVFAILAADRLLPP